MGFENAYSRDVNPISALNDWVVPEVFRDGAWDLGNFIRRYGGISFNKGLYRAHSGQDILQWTSIVEEAFPEFRTRILCFSSDWLGRHFAVDRARERHGEYLILMLEPGTGYVLEIPASVRTFHDIELVKYPNELLATEFYSLWRSSGGMIPCPTECIGYKKFLFMGGADVVDNLERIDMEVYWTLCGQLLNKTRKCPDGSRINRVDIE